MATTPGSTPDVQPGYFVPPPYPDPGPPCKRRWVRFTLLSVLGLLVLLAAISIMTGGGQGKSASEQCVIQRESGGNPRAVNPVSDAGGLFQFLPSTWAALGYAAQYPGGAQTAPAAVQEQAFAKAYAQSGTADWAAYDGCH